MPADGIVLRSARAGIAALGVAHGLLAGCYLAHERDVDASTDAARPVTAPLVWVVVHPSDAPLGPGLYLFDETTQTIVRRLPLPPGSTSPHALAWDGRSLWLGGVDEDPGVRELDPADGRVLSRWSGVQCEGIAYEGGRYWYAGVVSTLTPLVEVQRDGTTIGSLSLGVATVQELVAAEGSLYYLINDDLDRIVRVDPSTGASSDVTSGVHVAPYALGWDGRHLAVAVDGRITRFDRITGERVSEGPLGIPGWITAIAFER